MPGDDLANETSKLAISADDDNESNITFAAKRLAQEARQTLRFGVRGVRDVSETFAQAAARLPPGQLVKDEYFTLFEAVSALEIMDPKMDSGYVPPGDTFEPDFDVCQTLEGTEIIWIMDQLLSQEVSWHDGYPLSQTIYTSLHIDRLLSPDNRPPYTFTSGGHPQKDTTEDGQLVHIVLHAYCTGLIKCCQLVLHVVQSQNFYEEEDFVTHLFGRELLSRLGSNEALDLLDAALKWLQDADRASLSIEVRGALMQRLYFRRTLLAALANDATDQDTWPKLGTLISDINDSHAIGKPVPDAFSEKVQRRLATSTPPRPMLQVSWGEAYEKWTKLCADVVEADRLTSFWICQSPHCLQRATWAYAYREPQPLTFARAYFQNLLFGNDRLTENVTLFDLLLTDLRDLVLAGDSLADPDSFQVELPSDPRHACSRQIEAFMDRAFDEFLNLYRMVCQNRCRIRRTFTQSIPILDGLEGEAMQTDDALNGIATQPTLPGKKGVGIRLNPMASWVKYYKLRIMIWTIQLGFETDIYLPDELCTMYWLLSVFAHNECSLLEHIERFLVDRMKRLTQSRNTRYMAECLASQDWLKSLHLLADARRMMALACWRLSSILMAVGIIEAPKRDYAQRQLLYDARMKPYLGITNDPIPTPEDFERAQHNVKSIDSTCKSIELDIKEAKAHLAEVKQMTPQQAKYLGTEEQWKKELKQTETMCVAIAVQALQLGRLAEKHGVKGTVGDASLKGFVEVSIPAPGQRYHEFWVVPILKAKSK